MSMKSNSSVFRGFCTIWAELPDGRRVRHHAQRNLLVYSAGEAFARALAGQAYYPRGVYMQFENLADPEDPITVISPAVEDTAALFPALTSDFDFVRAELTMPAALETYGTSYENNQAHYYASIPATASSYNGNLTLSPANNSAVIGAGLVAIPSMADQTQDILIARIATPKLLLKTGMRVGIEWQIACTPVEE